MAATDASSTGPSKKPHPWMQAYSAPERFTPSSRIGCPCESTSALPATCTAGAAARAGAAKSVARTSATARIERGITVGIGVRAASLNGARPWVPPAHLALNYLNRALLRGPFAVTVEVQSRAARERGRLPP